MATWWSLNIEGDPSEADLEHIADLIIEGFTSGDLVDDEQQMRRPLNVYRSPKGME